MDKQRKKKKKQYLRHQQQLDAIIEKYGSFDKLKESRYLYKKNPNDKYKQCERDRLQVYRLLEKSKDLKKEKVRQKV